MEKNEINLEQKIEEWLTRLGSSMSTTRFLEIASKKKLSIETIHRFLLDTYNTNSNKLSHFQQLIKQTVIELGSMNCYYEKINKIINVDSKLILINDEYLIYPRTSDVDKLIDLKFITFDDILLTVPLIYEKTYIFKLLSSGLKNIREYLFQNGLEDEYFNLEVNLLTEMRK